MLHFLAETCTGAQADVRSYTSADAQALSHVPFVAEFTLKCSNNANNVNVYANVNGAVLPAIKVQGSSDKYQVSWTQDVKTAKAKNINVDLYDEDGYAAVKRAIDNDEDISSVKPMVLNTAGHVVMFGAKT